MNILVDIRTDEHANVNADAPTGMLASLLETEGQGGVNTLIGASPRLTAGVAPLAPVATPRASRRPRPAAPLNSQRVRHHTV